MRAVAIILALISFVGCSDKRHSADDAGEKPIAAGDSRYTCSMHPQVLQDKPGDCPVCGMDLVPVTEQGSDSHHIMLTDTQIRLAGITTERVTRMPIGQTVVINGRLAVDENKTEVISSRAEGRIEQLFVKETGQRIAKGEPLYVLYSELLLTLQQEYLLAKEQYDTLGHAEPRYRSFVTAAREKLLLYGLTPEQVTSLKDRRALQPRVTFLAPADGIVTKINIAEGQYVDEGTPLYTVDDISTLWVEAELYPQEAALVQPGDSIEVSVTGTSFRSLETEISFLSPEYRNNSQITIMRAPLGNPEKLLAPGQHAQIYLTHSTHEALTVPADAVIRDEQGSHVYVLTGENTFRPQAVKTGIENFERIEITAGLTERDTIAASGAYLLYAEYVLKRGEEPGRDAL